ncbi:hypothetical protein [Aminipila sp.]|uniref:hypothetical protein n=1 Tax=Aminipila sp. TaxID=2060095 RepID=UPI00289801BB|nr:hypothetical protein [Aminipila sp.]
MKKISIGKIFIVLLLIFVLVLMYGNITQSNQLRNNIVGTYLLQGSIPTDSHYLVFTNDNKYTYYKPFEILDEGTYSETDKRLYAMTNQSGHISQAILYGKTLYFYGNNSKEITIYNKIESIPLYINLKKE